MYDASGDALLSVLPTLRFRALLCYPRYTGVVDDDFLESPLPSPRTVVLGPSWFMGS